jgi:hypothetical protein
MFPLFSSLIIKLLQWINKMILVVGNSAKRVELKDLQDVVYFKQQKSYNDADYERSQDLRREIKSGRLLVINRSTDERPSSDGKGYANDPIVIKHEEPVTPEPVIIEKEVVVEKEVPSGIDPSKLDLLLEKVLSLEKKINESPAQDKDVLMRELISSLDDKLDARLSSLTSKDEVGKSESKDSGINDKIDVLIDLIKSGAHAGPGISSSNVSDYTQPSRVEDVYVPSIKVEDANAKISLKTRVVESGNQVADALGALKKLKNNK